MANIFVKRLTKELRDFRGNPPTGLSLEAGDDLKCCRIHLEASQGTVYEGEKFLLQFKFEEAYPLEAPEVMFIGGVFGIVQF